MCVYWPVNMGTQSVTASLRECAFLICIKWLIQVPRLTRTWKLVSMGVKCMSFFVRFTLYIYSGVSDKYICRQLTRYSIVYILYCDYVLCIRPRIKYMFCSVRCKLVYQSVVYVTQTAPIAAIRRYMYVFRIFGYW